MNFQKSKKNFSMFLLFALFQIFHLCKIFATETQDPDPLRFSKDFSFFAEQDFEKKGLNENLVLFTGSSSIRMWQSLYSDFPEINLLNRGFGGAHLSDILHFYDRLFTRYQPQRIVLYCGENDLWSGKKVEQVMNNFRTLWSKINYDLPTSTLIYISCKPSPKRISKWNTYQSFNLLIKNLAQKDNKLTFVDISPTLLRPDLSFYPGLWKKDSLHLNQAGYKRWTSWIRPTLGLK